MIKANKDEIVLQRGFLSLKDGVQQPVNKMPGVRAGNLETFLLTKEGKIQKADTTDKLKQGELFITVYTPPGYDPEEKPRYNLQITLDGGQYLHIQQMNFVMDNLIAANEIEPVVNVFITPCSGPPSMEEAGFPPVIPKGYPLSMRLREYCCNPEFADQLATLANTI